MSKISKDLDKEVREASKNRCGYCLTPQILTSHKLEIEHIYPTSKGGNSEKENLCLACRHCNLHKSSKIYGFDAVSAKRVRLFNPNRQKWTEHFICYLEQRKNNDYRQNSLRTRNGLRFKTE